MDRGNRPSASNELGLEQGPYLTSVEVENVRCFSERQKLVLATEGGVPARWTVILGENGVGKTTLLQLLALAPSSGVQLRYLADFDYDAGPSRPLSFSRHEGSRGTVAVELLLFGRPMAFSFLVGHEGHPEGSVDGVSHPLVCGYGAGRRLGASRLSRRYRRSSGVNFASLFRDVPLQNAEEWLLGEDYAAAKEGLVGGPAQKRLDRLKELLTRLLPEVTDVRVGAPQRHWEPAVEFETPYGWVPLHALSLGYQSLVAWMVDLAAAMMDFYEDSPDPLAEPAIVLVDEIDIHLHPKWQRDLIRFLTERFPNTQFIATAHSPLVVQAAEGANVVLLKREGDHVVINNNAADVRNWRIDQILTSDLYGLPTARPPRLDKLIAERRALLTKATLTAADQRKLNSIEAQIGELPAGETPDEQAALALILRVAKDIEQPAKPKKKR